MLAAVAIFGVVVWFGLVGPLRTRLFNSRMPQSMEQFREALGQPDFGMYYVDFSPPRGLDLDFASIRRIAEKALGWRKPDLGPTRSFGDLLVNYSIVADKRISYGSDWEDLTNQIVFDDSIPRTRTALRKEFERIFRRHGGYVFSLNLTNDVLLTEQDLKVLGIPIPDRPPLEP